MDMPFFPGRKPSNPEPLAVFLPPYSEGVGAEFLRRLGARGKRVVDPFGQSPALALELARNGAAVLVASPNPVLRAILGLQADPPSAQLMRGVFGRLARSSPSSSPDRSDRPSESLEAHIRSFYLGKCAFCGKESEADGFIWAYESEPAAFGIGRGSERSDFLREEDQKKTKPRLIRRICHCPACDHVVEEPATPDDERRMPRESSLRMLYTLALEKLAPLDDPNRMHAMEALEVYPLRSIYALFLCLTRWELMSLTPEEKRCAEALLLAALDEAHILRGHGRFTRLRPRSLQPPAEFREVNIWRAMERAIEGANLPARPVPIRKWREGEKPEEGTILVFAGMARELAKHFAETAPDALITFLPRPNQAAWTLSAMWAGWLWGRAAVAPISGMLHRRRYDWNWHARALTASAMALAAGLRSETPVAAFLGESEPAFLAAALWSFSAAGFLFKGRAFRADTDTAQFLWSTPGPDRTPAAGGARSVEPAAEVARLASRQIISWRAEPTPWELLHAAAWSEVVYRRLLTPNSSQEQESGFSKCQNSISAAVEKDPERRSTPPEELEYGQAWWLPGDQTIASPLSDQVEMEVARILLEEGPLSAEELDARICAFFPGLLTPEARLIRACLASYGSPGEGGFTWGIRPEDFPATREEELVIIRTLLGELGRKMGLVEIEGDALYWTDTGGRKVYCFRLTSTAAIGRFLLQPIFDTRHSWIVLPGGRAPLVEYKLRRNILLRRAVGDGWRFLKFRHIRRLLEDPLLSPANLDERMGLDPLGAKEDQVPYL
jgi:hypothetical protein